MLILSRKRKQSVVIGGNIEVQIASIDGESVRLAIKAPREIEVHRKEVFDAIKASNREAVVDSSKGGVSKGALQAVQRMNRAKEASDKEKLSPPCSRE